MVSTERHLMELEMRLLVWPVVAFALLMPLFCFAQTNLQPASYQFVAARTGMQYYLDRNYTLANLPAFLQETTMLKTANDDKADSTLSISFNLPKLSTIFLAYDPRATIQSWPYELDKLLDTLKISGDPKISHMNLYRFKADSLVTLPANQAQSMYFLFVDVPVDTLEGSGVTVTWDHPEPEPKMTFRIYYDGAIVGIADSVQPPARLVLAETGKYKLHVTAIDSVGNESDPSVPVRFYFESGGDLFAPLPPINVDVAGDTVNIDAQGRVLQLNVQGIGKW